MEENIKHIQNIRESNLSHVNVTFCGKKIDIFEFTFAGVDHAVNNNQSGGYLLPCPDCKEAVIKFLNKEG